VTDSGLNACEISEPIMADDGSGADIFLPSFLLFKGDADQIKGELMSMSNSKNSAQASATTPLATNNLPIVMMELAWSLRPLSTSSSPRVEYAFWFVPGDVTSARFLNDFFVIAQSLGDRAYFTPHVVLQDGPHFHCEAVQNKCSHLLCTNGGRYCAIPPHSFLASSSSSNYNNHDDDGGEELRISGVDVVTESLREICIWIHYGRVDGIGEIWWNYIREFTTQCQSSPADFVNEDCINNAYERAGVDRDKIVRCIRDSGGLTRDARNVLLDLELNLKVTNGISISPALYVNGLKVTQQLSISNALAAICDAYPRSDDVVLPRICNDKCFDCPDVLACVTNNDTCYFASSHEDETSKNHVQDDNITATATNITYRVPAMDIGDDNYGDEMEFLVDGVSNRTLFFGMLLVNLFLVVLLATLCLWMFFCRQKKNSHE
jgi:hypothetical protein